jgi:hypothetical protein
MLLLLCCSALSFVSSPRVHSSMSLALEVSSSLRGENTVCEHGRELCTVICAGLVSPCVPQLGAGAGGLLLAFRKHALHH